MKKATVIGMVIMMICSVFFVGCGIGNNADSELNKEDWINPPAGDMAGKNYEVVIKAFEDAGFTNVGIKKIEDYYNGLTVKLGEVEEVTINGKRYKADKLYDPEAEVVVSYHAYESWDAYKREYETNGWGDPENRVVNTEDEEYFRSFIGKRCNEVIDSANDHDYTIFFTEGTTIRNEVTDDVRRNPNWYVIEDLIYLESHDLIATYLVSEDIP